MTIVNDSDDNDPQLDDISESSINIDKNREIHNEYNYIKMDEEDKEQKIIFVQNILNNILFHPVEYVKVLCQLGYEPIKPKLTRTIFGNNRYILPNMFQYMKYIKRTDGYLGCFNGLLPTLVGNFISAAFSQKIVRKINIISINIDDPPNIINDDEPDKDKYITYTKREIVLHTVSVIISYPFRVVTIRMMASFIGREEGYSSIFKAMRSVYRENGLFGFYNGIIPRLIGDLLSIGVSMCASYYVNKYFLKTRESRGYAFPTCMFITSSITYPFTVVSTCMAVNGSSLIAGNPPQMPIYSSWRACFSDLVNKRQHKRGGSLFFRYLP